jgi:hypothetical protein
MQVNPFAPDRSRVEDVNVGLAAINHEDTPRRQHIVDR